MKKEFKNLSFASVKADDQTGRRRKGVAAVFGNIDSWGDRIKPGAFSKTISEGGLKRVRHLWNHDSRTPPIASITDIKEVGREDLPPEVLEKAPDATGGLVVEREYYENDLAAWVLEAVDKGDVNEMSFAFETVKSQYVEEEIPGTEKTHEVRELLELRLFDTSDVNWGMNSATVASGAKSLLETIPLGLVYKHFSDLEEVLKKGLIESDRELLQKIYDLAGGILEIPKNAEPITDKPEKETEPGEPEPLDNTPLSKDWFEFQKTQLKTLEI